MYQSEIKNAKIDIFIYKTDNLFIIIENDKFKY